MNIYNKIKKKHFQLFIHYHRWYAEPQKPAPFIKYTSFRTSSGFTNKRKAIYRELVKLRRARTQAWRNYKNEKRFNVFKLVFYKKTNVCPEFCRHFVLSYLNLNINVP